MNNHILQKNKSLDIHGLKLILILTAILIIKSLLYSDTNYLIPIGHSTVFIHLDKINIITDPNWNGKNLLLHRLQEPPFPITHLPPIDIVLISHGHFDHMDLNTLIQIFQRNKKAKFFLPLNLGYLLKKYDINNYRELNPNEIIKFGPLEIKSYKALHNGRRFIIDNTDLSLCYIIKGTKTIFFSGDTGYTNLFQTIGQKEKVDYALLMIGVWTHMPPFIRKLHLQSDEAIAVFKDLKSRFLIPIHYDIFPFGLSGQIHPLDLLKQTAEKENILKSIIIQPFGTKIILK